MSRDNRGGNRGGNRNQRDDWLHETPRSSGRYRQAWGLGPGTIDSEPLEPTAATLRAERAAAAARGQQQQQQTQARPVAGALSADDATLHAAFNMRRAPSATLRGGPVRGAVRDATLLGRDLLMGVTRGGAVEKKDDPPSSTSSSTQHHQPTAAAAAAAVPTTRSAHASIEEKMDPDQLLPVPENIDDVDTTVPPQSAEHYMAQVIATRRACPVVVRSEVARRPQPEKLTEEAAVFEAPATAAAAAAEPPARNAHAPTEEWVQAKVALFSAYREQLAAQRERLPKLDVKWPAMSGSLEERWVAAALEECAPEVPKDVAERYPAHKGTPPAIAVLAAMSTAQIHFLLRALLDNWDDDERPSEALLQWVHSLLLFADLPIMPDVCASLRAFVRAIRTRRATATDDASRLHWLQSSFIALVAHAFDQKDLAD